MSFRFIDPGKLIDGELELVLADQRWFDDLLVSAMDSRCRGDANADATSADSLEDFARLAPGGMQPADRWKGLAPSYHFLMRWIHPDAPLPIAGGMGLRIGESRDLEMYLGHVGYHVFPPARGHRLAERSVRLILPLARQHGMRRLWITCNPDNLPSRRTCERLGGQLVQIVDLPTTHALYRRGERQKCRYLLPLDD